MPSLLLLILIYSAFIALGLPDGLLGVAWPSMRLYFGVPLEAVGLLSITGTAGYLISSFFSGRLVSRFGVMAVLSASCLLTGFVLLFYTVSPSWWLVVFAVFLSGLGGGAIDSGLNLYTARNLGTRHMQWIHACWGLGITAGPFIMTAGINILHSWKPGYVITGAIQVCIAVLFFAYAFYKREAKKSSDEKTPAAGIIKTLSMPKAWGNMALFFTQSGIEITLGLWGYTVLTETRGIEPVVAGIITGSFWGFFTFGRILAGFYTKHIGQNLLVILSLCLALAGAAMLWQSRFNILCLAGFVFTGFAFAPVFPAMMSGTAGRMGKKHAGNMVGMQMSSAALGSAVLPAAAGVLAGRFSPGLVPVFLFFLLVVMIVLFAVFMRKKPAEAGK